MSSTTTPLVITVMHTPLFSVPNKVLVEEIADLVGPIVNVRKHKSTVQPTRQIIVNPIPVSDIEDGCVDLTVHIAGTIDDQVAVDYGVRERCILSGLHALYRDTQISVVIKQQDLFIDTRTPRTLVSGHDNSLASTLDTTVQAICNKRIKRVDDEQRRLAEAELTNRLDQSIGKEHKHLPGGQVSLYI